MFPLSGLLLTAYLLLARCCEASVPREGPGQSLSETRDRVRYQKVIIRRDDKLLSALESHPKL